MFGRALRHLFAGLAGGQALQRSVQRGAGRRGDPRPARAPACGPHSHHRGGSAFVQAHLLRPLRVDALADVSIMSIRRRDRPCGGRACRPSRERCPASPPGRANGCPARPRRCGSGMPAPVQAAAHAVAAHQGQGRMPDGKSRADLWASQPRWIAGRAFSVGRTG